jgi:hypothetical protein
MLSPAGDLHILETQARAAVHIDAERGGAAPFQVDVHPHPFAGRIAGGEALGDRADGGEHGIEEEAVLGEHQFHRTRIGEQFVLAAARQQRAQGQGQKEMDRLQSAQRWGYRAITARPGDHCARSGRVTPLFALRTPCLHRCFRSSAPVFTGHAIGDPKILTFAAPKRRSVIGI